MTNRIIITAAFMTALAVAPFAQAQGIVGGAREGSAAGDRAAGPVGGVVGGAVGAGVGGVVGGVKGVVGIPDRRAGYRRSYRAKRYVRHRRYR